ncbi:nonsense-mediated mRNA decay factor SMG5 [Anopheles darlingi]|uniref:nonsense-mediated mRNA decay factor SMG5 n=1 Tax=Anopheles darlingi TaxID=43151 RepID=UPI00210055BD|nr:nonsense-mediated mRNA decay factor SMG5 [Anopheles darlingi]
MEYSSNDVKQLFRSVYTLVKGQDERKADLTANEILEPSFQLSHRLLISQCIQLIFEDFESVGVKSREILWRKGYYDVISVLKRQKGNVDGAVLQQAADQLIQEGSNYFKAIVLRFAELFHLETLKYLVDFALLDNYDDDALRQEASCYSLLQLRNEPHATSPQELYTKQEISYALETIHSLLISLGDLHRYRLEFGLGQRAELRTQTRNFYLEAFKLNPKIGMPHNQLGMLVTGQNNNLDAVYHYLYSLCCVIPFECSEPNVNNIFQKNIRQLENAAASGDGGLADEDRTIKQFIATFLLVVDVFFYDKNVTDFTALCHSVLIDFKKALSIRELLGDFLMTDDMIFKIVSILFFCMHRIRMCNSDKIYSLNAFLVALCSELLEYCTLSIEKCIVEKVRDDNRFQELYLERYQQNDEKVLRTRAMAKHGMYSKDQKSSSGVEEGTGSQDSRGTNSKECMNGDSKSRAQRVDSARKTSAANGISIGRSKQKQTRRRRRAFSNESDTEDEEVEHQAEGDRDDDYSNRDFDSEHDFSSASEASEEDDNEEDDEDDDEEEEEDGQDIMSLSSYGSYDSTRDEEHQVDQVHNGKQHGKKKQLTGQQQNGVVDGHGHARAVQDGEHLKFKKRYQKTNPNIVLEFANTDRTIRSLKILFDWLHCNMDVLFNCYQSNPEFVEKIMKLLNYFNIDIFCNRIYFCRELITVPGLREDLQTIFVARRTIPLREDIAMKRFPLFEPTQEGLLWETSYKYGISAEDESLLRLMKMVDFGFAVLKTNKFDYCFDSKTREFNLRSARGRQPRVAQKNKKKKHHSSKREWNGGKQHSKQHSKQQQQHGFSRDRQRQEKRRPRTDVNGERQPRILQNDDDDPGDIFVFPSECRRNRMRNESQQTSNRTGNYGGGLAVELPEKPAKKNISTMMGKLWLEDQVKQLEAKVNHKVGDVLLTPYVMVDAKCLADYTSIVKNLVKMKKFIVLIPKAVLSELDKLKKCNEGARSAIKWLEIELTKGNRFLRIQKPHETLPMPLVKIPKKLDREGALFTQIVQFCNHIVTTQGDDDGFDIITYLSGDSLANKKLGNGSSYVGILEAIPVKFEQIVTFYSAYKRK